MTEPGVPSPEPGARSPEENSSSLRSRLRRMGVALQSPILVREMRALLRGRKFFVSHMLLLTVLAGVLLIAATTSAARGLKDPAQVGIILYWAFALGLSVVVIFLVPAFSCTAITTEREGKTLDLLLTTTIRPWEVVWGKLLSALVVILLFMASALPLVTVCFLFGGISPWDLGILYLAVLFSTLVVSSVSLSVSAHCKESKSAVVIAYVLTLIIVVGISVAGRVLAASFLGGRGAGALSAVLTGYTWKEQVLIVVAPQFLGVAIFAVNFAAAANRLKPPTANRSTSLRVIWLLFLLGGLLLYMLSVGLERGLGKITGGDWGDLLLATQSVAAPLFWIGVLYFASEEALLPARLAEDSARLRSLRLPLRMFMPGPLTGVAYATFFVLVVFGGLTLFTSMSVWGAALGPAASAPSAGLAWRNLSAAVPLALFMITSAGIGALFSSFGFRHRGAGLAAFGTAAVLAFGPLIHLACQQAISGGQEARSTLWNLHYLSPVAAMISAWGGSARGAGEVLTLPGGETVPLWAASAVAYALLGVAVCALACARVLARRARWRRQLAALAADGPARAEGS